MDKTKFLEKILEIGSVDDDAKRRSLLTELSDDVSKVFDEKDNLSTINEKLTKDVEDYKENEKKLNEYNMSLWQRVNSQKTEVEAQEVSTGIKKEEEEKLRSFEEIAQDFMK